MLSGDGTIGNMKRPNFVFGVKYPEVSLVVATSDNKLVVDTEMLFSGQSAPLTLLSHPSYAIVLSHSPRRINAWGVSHQHLGVGEAAEALTVRKGNKLIISSHATSGENGKKRGSISVYADRFYSGHRHLHFGYPVWQK